MTQPLDLTLVESVQWVGAEDFRWTFNRPVASAAGTTPGLQIAGQTGLRSAVISPTIVQLEHLGVSGDGQPWAVTGSPPAWSFEPPLAVPQSGTTV